MGGYDLQGCRECGHQIDPYPRDGQNVCEERACARTCCWCAAHGCGRDPDAGEVSP